MRWKLLVVALRFRRDRVRRAELDQPLTAEIAEEVRRGRGEELQATFFFPKWERELAFMVSPLPPGIWNQ